MGLLKKRTSLEYKLELAANIHDNKYDYSLVKYTRFDDKVKIICPVHGVFEQMIYTHSVEKQGCPKCGREKVIKMATEPADRWVKRMSDKFPHLCFKESVYITSKIKVKVRCRKHGYFESVPRQIGIAGGCWHCGRERAAKHSRENPSFWSKSQWKDKGINSKNFHSFKVYVIKCWNEKEEFYKIGRTFTTTEHRFRHKFLMPYKFLIIKEFLFEDDASSAFNKENSLKKINKSNKYIPSINFGGKHECYTKVITQ